ncbi:MAG: class B sortase [Lachnospiraceae bacterium]|nr:class B sortase [Lachnospiraceae bacterium]
MTKNRQTMSRRQKRRLKGILIGVLLTIFVGVFVFSLVRFIQEVSEYAKAEKIYDNLKESLVANTIPVERPTKDSGTNAPTARPTASSGETKPSGTSESPSMPDSSEALDPTEPTEATGSPGPITADYSAYEHPKKLNFLHTTFDYILVPMYEYNLAKLSEINPEICGWIEISGTHIDYTVVQGTDNAKYLRVAATGEANNAGSLFVDYRIENPFSAKNTIIYGHNQRNNRMFHELLSYENKEFLQSHPLIKILTMDGKMLIYRVYSAYYMTNTYTYKYQYSSEQVYQKYLDYTLKESLYDFEMVPNTSQTILTLSTCTNEFDERRFVVHAVLISGQ